MTQAPLTGIARADWDFSQCPRDKLYFCYTYEFAREVALREVPAFLKVFKKARKRVYDDHANWHYILQGPVGSEGLTFLEIIDAPYGFPEKAYLELNHQPTDLRSYHPFHKGYPFQSPAFPLHEIQFEKGRFRLRNLQQDIELKPSQVTKLQIDWNYRVDQIMTALEQWVLQHHPDGIVDQRGKSAYRRYRKGLKALGAWRLIDSLGTAEAAIKHTATFSDINDGAGLFRQPSGWSEAKEEARALLDEWKVAFAYSGLNVTF